MFKSRSKGFHDKNTVLDNEHRRQTRVNTINKGGGKKDSGSTPLPQDGGGEAQPRLVLPPPEKNNPPLDETGHPSPEQRADFVVKRLEQFIREGRTLAEGMSLRQWQDMARMEIALAVAAAEDASRDDDAVTRRVMFTLASALVTVGFWGTVFAFDKAPYLVVALIFTLTGLITLAIVGEWRFMKYLRRHQARKRAKSLHRIEDLTWRIKRMEKELEKESDGLRDKLKEQIKQKRAELNGNS